MHLEIGVDLRRKWDLEAYMGKKYIKKKTGSRI